MKNLLTIFFWSISDITFSDFLGCKSNSLFLMLLRNEERILVDLKFPGDKFSSVQVFSDKNIESITKLLESVKKLGEAEKTLPIKNNNNLKNLQAIYTQPPKKSPPPQKKYIINSTDKSSPSKPILSIKLLKNQRKSFDHSKPAEKKPKKEI